MSLCYRAKYRVTKKILDPAHVVPHPHCWGKPVDSLRTKQLATTIIRDGYDSIKANRNLVAVEENPRLRGYFSSNFECLAAFDDDLDRDTCARFGSLSNCSLNCLIRNILWCSKGCICVSEDEVCACQNAPILDRDGTYDNEKLKAHDKAWFLDCEAGLGWEILSYKMDIEEPKAALIISHTLRDERSKMAMETAHSEIMSTLISLCTPWLQALPGDLVFQLARNKMRGMFGAAVDDQHFLDFFRVVFDAGGADSVHVQDLEHFTSTYVNEKFRKIRMKVYAMVAKYPRHFPRIKMACIKWSWKQPTESGGHCTLPPSIGRNYLFATLVAWPISCWSLRRP